MGHIDCAFPIVPLSGKPFIKSAPPIVQTERTGLPQPPFGSRLVISACNENPLVKMAWLLRSTDFLVTPAPQENLRVQQSLIRKDVFFRPTSPSPKMSALQWFVLQKTCTLVMETLSILYSLFWISSFRF
jgi:hypothetical protein